MRRRLRVRARARFRFRGRMTATATSGGDRGRVRFPGRRRGKLSGPVAGTAFWVRGSGIVTIQKADGMNPHPGVTGRSPATASAAAPVRSALVRRREGRPDPYPVEVVDWPGTVRDDTAPVV